MKTTISAQRKGNSGSGTGLIRKLQAKRDAQNNKSENVRGLGGWKQSRDISFMATQQKRFRLKVRGYEPTGRDADVDLLVRQFKKKGGKVTKLKPGIAMGAHRSGVEILVG